MERLKETIAIFVMPLYRDKDGNGKLPGRNSNNIIYLPATKGNALFIFIALFFFVTDMGCKSSSKIQQSTKRPGETLAINKTGSDLNKIAFLTFEVLLSDSTKDLYTFRLKNTIFAPGSLKQDTFEKELDPAPNFFYCQVSDKNKKVLNYQKIQNPLKAVYEYSSEKGVLNKVLIEKRSGELVVRFNYNKDCKYISFSKSRPGTNALITIYHALL